MKFHVSNSFLVRIYKRSKSLFSICILFSLTWFFLSYKKMDMLFFPRNDMFSHFKSDSTFRTIHYVRLNGVPVVRQHFLYWKKEILEGAVNQYVHYIQQQRKTALQSYLELKTDRSSLFEDKLFPQRVYDREWFEWYMNYSAIQLKPGDYCELVSYKMNADQRFEQISVHATLVY